MDNHIVPGFKVEKAIAVAATFLIKSGGNCNKYWLNKVMYFAERESLIRSGQPLFFDELFALPLGPIVSAVNDGIDISAYPIDSIWANFISLEVNSVILKKEPDYSVLSNFENNLIQEINDQFKGWDFSKMHQFFHNLPENKVTTSREDISYAEILEAEGFDPALIQETLSEISYLSEMESTLSSAS